MNVAVLLALSALVLAACGLSAVIPATAAAVLVAVLIAERLVVGIRTAVQRHDASALLFPVVHLLRDLAWAAAILRWTSRKIHGRTSRPAHSMHPRGTIDPVRERVG